LLNTPHPLEGERRPSEAILAALRGVFTTDTEDGEIACVLHLKIPDVPTRGATQSRGRFVRSRRRRRCGPYPPSPRLLEGILVPLVWVHLHVCTWIVPGIEGILYSLHDW
jgi:hypothetical protein